MSWIAAAVLVLYVTITFGLRSWLQWRRTGSTGVHGISGRPGSLEWLAGVLLVLAFAAAPLGLVLDLTRSLPPVEALRAVRWLGLVVLVVGFAATFLAQLAMGSSWRIGVKKDEVTTLVTEGVFAIVRNPIFSAMLLALLGLALATPNVVSVLAWVVAVVAMELQVRFVEEPYLEQTHGDAYRAYMTRVGRFLPGLGRRPR